MIAIIDYDMGNLRSVAKAFEKVGATAAVTRDPKAILNASHVVLPGVGAFKDCMRNLDEYGLIDPIIKSIESGKPFLGICLGLQLLFDESMEFGHHRGLGVVKGKVVRFPEGTGLKVPHMGWNEVRQARPHPVWQGVPDGARFYFVHSYYPQPAQAALTAATCAYGVTFTCAVARDNIFAVQFHPEKSQNTGLQLLSNFVQWRP